MSNTQITNEQPRVKRSEIEMPVRGGAITVISVDDVVTARFDIKDVQGKTYAERLESLVEILQTAAAELRDELRYVGR